MDTAPSWATATEANAKSIFENPGTSPNSERNGSGAVGWPNKQCWYTGPGVAQTQTRHLLRERFDELSADADVRAGKLDLRFRFSFSV